MTSENNKKMEKESVVENPVNDSKVSRKHRGRGISNNTRATSRKKFDERQDANHANGLFIGHLENVEVSWATLKEDANIPSFAGNRVPYLVFTFASNAENANDRKYYTHRISPAESNAETIPGGKGEWKVNIIFQFMKHIYDVFVLKGRDMTEEEEDALTLPFEDFEDNGEGGYNYVPVEPEVVLDGYKVLFENFVKLMNNNGKPHYKDAKGNFLPIWMKLIRFTKRNGKWNALVGGNSTFGDLAMPTFIGEGVIELFKDAQTLPKLHVDINKESIIYIKSAEQGKKPNIGAPAMGGAAPMANSMNGGVMTGGMNPAFGGFDGGNSFDSGFPQAPTMVNSDGDDLPF